MTGWQKFLHAAAIALGIAGIAVHAFAPAVSPLIDGAEKAVEQELQRVPACSTGEPACNAIFAASPYEVKTAGGAACLCPVVNAP